MKSSTIFLQLFFILLQIKSFAQQPVTPLKDDKREQFIQNAQRLRTADDYRGAIQQLDSILIQNPGDASILLFKGDLQLQSKTYNEAAETYTKLLPLNYETTIAQINLSYALFMNHRPAKALQYAELAWKGNSTNTNAVVNYFNAMLWNRQTKEAAIFLQKNKSLITPAQQLVLKARLYTTSGDYTNGLKYYDSLITTYPDKYYIQEYAEVLLGKKEWKQSEATMLSSGKLFTGKEYNAYRQKLKASREQNAGTEFIYFKDVAKNIRIENNIWWQQREGNKYRFRLNAGISSLTSVQHEKTNTRFAHVNITERWNKAWTGETDLQLQFIQTYAGKHFTGITGKQTLQYQPNDRRMVGFFYSADILDFTASILGNKIYSHNAGYVTHLMMSGKTGFYSQGSAGVLSDKNERYQFFGSVYHLFRTEPVLKAGINFSALHYRDNAVKNYFSPHQYLHTELFADYKGALPGLSKFYGQVQAAAGLQRIEHENWEPCFRFQTELGFKLNHLETSIKYQTSNVASANGTGYSFNWYTVRLMWKW